MHIFVIDLQLSDVGSMDTLVDCITQAMKKSNWGTLAHSFRVEHTVRLIYLTTPPLLPAKSADIKNRIMAVESLVAEKIVTNQELRNTAQLLGVTMDTHASSALNVVLESFTIVLARNAELEARNAELEARNAELEARHAELEARHAELEARHAELEARHAELEARNAELEARNAELEARNAELEARNAELEARVARLEDVLRRAGLME